MQLAVVCDIVMRNAKRMLGKAMVGMAGKDIIDKPTKPNVQKLRYATNRYLVFMIQFHLSTTIALVGFHDGGF